VMREPAWTIALIFPVSPVPNPSERAPAVVAGRSHGGRIARDLGSGGNYSLRRSGSIPSFRQASRQAVPILWLMPTPVE
jgi:hypothetical protein